MLDKAELQELLVRLKLGTVSVDSAIEEIEKNFYDEREETSGFLKRAGFDRVVFCGNKDEDYLKKIINNYLEKRISFICINLDKEMTAKLASLFDGLDIVYDAGIAFKTYVKPAPKAFKTVILSSSHQLCRPCLEAETVLRLVGIDVETVSCLHPYKLLSIKNRINNASVVIVASESPALAEVAAELFSGVVVALPLSEDDKSLFKGVVGMYGAVLSPYGVSAVNINSGFAAAMAVYRCFLTSVQ